MAEVGDSQTGPLGRLQPQSIEAEQAVLGGLMLDNRAFYDVDEFLSADDFYRPQHLSIYRSMHRLMNANEPIDPVTVSQDLRAHEELDAAGGLGYLAELTETTLTAQNTVAYARIVRERAVLRQLISAAQRIADAAFRPEGKTIPELLDHAEQQIFRIQEHQGRSAGPQPVLQLLTRAVQRVEALYESKNPITGLPTGFTDLDIKTAGLQPGDMIIVAARPSMGKTAFSLNMVERALMHDVDGAVLFFSMENAGRISGHALAVGARPHRSDAAAHRRPR